MKPWEKYATQPTGASTHDGLPAVQNADGSYSTELSVTVTDPRLNGGKPTNIPSLWGGKKLADADAVTAALGSGRRFDAFPSIDEAVSAAKERSAAGGAQAPAGPWTKYAPAQPAPFDPTGTASQNVAAGMGAKITDLALGLKQRLAGVLEGSATGAGVDAIVQALGGESSADRVARVQQEVDEKRKLDAPLMATTGGKIGAAAGATAPAILASMIPGGQGLAGSIITGAALGGAEPTSEGESALKNAAAGGIGGAAGYGLSKLLGAGAEKVIQARAASQAANAVKDAAAVDTKAAGYVIPPSQTNPTLTNRALEGLAGKISTGQAASVKNQTTTNALARQALGMAPDAPLTTDALKAVRQQAGQAYDVVKNLGPVTADAKYANDLLSISSSTKNAAKNFPGLAKDEIDDVVASLNQKSFDSSGAVDAIRLVRDKADAAFSQGDKSLGKAYRAAADAIEGVLERNLQASGNPDALAAFQQARQLIAKSYSVEKALNPVTGNVAAQKLGSQLARQKPLSGELETIAKLGLAYPKAAQEITTSIPGVSPLDFMGAAGLSAATANPLMMATAAARPVARSVILSRPYQAAMGTPSYNSTIAQLLATRPASEAVRIGALISPQAMEKK